jgi:hypothetical protein
MNDIVLLSSPFNGISVNLPISSPFKGEVRRGMGSEAAECLPHPHPNPPLEGEGVSVMPWGAT